MREGNGVIGQFCLMQFHASETADAKSLVLGMFYSTSEKPVGSLLAFREVHDVLRRADAQTSNVLSFILIVSPCISQNLGSHWFSTMNRHGIRVLKCWPKKSAKNQR